MKLAAIAASVGVASALLAAPPSVADPGLQPGLVEAVCPRPVDTDCGTIAYPAVDVWALGAVLPITDAPEARAAYDALIPEPFTPPADGERQIGVLMFRLDIPLDPASSADTDPGEGYAEGSVAIRVGFPAADGFPYTEGWWNLAQPLNDAGQYGAGRSTGLPKYMADAEVRRNDDGSWRASAIDWGKTVEQGDQPGSATVAEGNALTIAWAPEPSITLGADDRVWRWGQYGEPLFGSGHTTAGGRPYDEAGGYVPSMVKFTPTGLVPVAGVPRTVVTEYPEPVPGTATVTLEGAIPGFGSEISAGSFADIIEPGSHTVAGTMAFTKGYAFLTVDALANNTAG